MVGGVGLWVGFALLGCGLVLLGWGSFIFTGCRPFASLVPPNGSPSGLDQKSVGASQFVPMAGLPLLSMVDSSETGSRFNIDATPFSKSLISDNC